MKMEKILKVDWKNKRLGRYIMQTYG